MFDFNSKGIEDSLHRCKKKKKTTFMTRCRPTDGDGLILLWSDMSGVSYPGLCRFISRSTDNTSDLKVQAAADECLLISSHVSLIFMWSLSLRLLHYGSLGFFFFRIVCKRSFLLVGIIWFCAAVTALITLLKFILLHIC